MDKYIVCKIKEKTKIDKMNAKIDKVVNEIIKKTKEYNVFTDGSCLNNDSFEISSITSRAKLATSGDWVVDIHSIKYLNNMEMKTCKLLSEDYE